MDWYAEVEFSARATNAKIGKLAPGYVATYYSPTDRLLRLRQNLGDHTEDQAFAAAQRWVTETATPAVLSIDPDALVIRIVVESAGAVARRVVGAGEFAKMLGVTPTRLRQLQNEQADFPAGLETSAGKIWPADVAETYAARRPPQSKGGRPRKNIE